jgi:hypothetical protein
MKIVITLLLTFFIVSAANAQIRHVRHIKSIDLMYGITGFGTTYSAGYVSYLSNTSYIKFGGFYEQGISQGLPYTSIGLEPYFAKNIIRGGYKYYLNAIGGAHVSVDNSGATLGEFKIPSAFKMGVLLGIENELFISDKFVLIINFSQRILLAQEYGSYRFFAQAGIRYNF